MNPILFSVKTYKNKANVNGDNKNGLISVCLF